jgi:hypothetical protein
MEKNKKTILVLIGLSLFLLHILDSRGILNDVQKVFPGIINNSKTSIQGLNVKETEIPEEVMNVVEKYSEYYSKVKKENDEQEMADKINRIKDWAILFVLVFIIVSLFLKKTIKREYRSVRRTARRFYLYYLIKKQLKKGKSFKEIEHNLIKKGHYIKHVKDAVIRYQKHKKGD